MKRVILFFLGLSVALVVRAVNPEPYALGVSFSFRIVGTGNGNLTVYDSTGTSPTLAQSTSGPYATESGMATAWLVPGQEYQVNINTSGITGHWLSFIAPEGYQTWIDGVPTSIYFASTSSGAYNVNHTLVLRSFIAGGRRDMGAFSGINLGKAIGWEIGLGGNRSAHSMGLVGFRERDLTNSPSSRDRLIYSPPINNFQCTVVRDGALSQTVRQIRVAQGVLDFVDDGSGGYNINFYDNNPAHWTWTGSAYTSFTVSPWKIIHVESPAANQLKITETEDSVSRVSYLSLTSGTVLTGNYVLTLQEGDTSTWLRTTTHTSTAYSDGTRDDIVVTRTGGTSGTIVAKTKYRYSNPGGLNTNQSNTINYNTTTFPLSTTASSTVTFNCNVTNSGTNTWGGNHQLCLRDGGGTILGTPVSLSGLAPGSNTTVSLSLTAPAFPGTYTYTLHARENTAWFASIATISLTVVSGGGSGTTDTANYTATTFPLSVMPGMAVDFTTTLTNTGTNAWGGNHYLVLRDGSWSNLSFASLNGVSAGASTTATLTLPAPFAGGTYAYHLHGENNGVTWFSTSAPVSLIVNGTSWGEEVVQIIDDPDTAALTKTFEYYTNPSNWGNYRRVRSVTEGTGNWTAFTYYDDWDRRGQVQYEYHPYLDSPSTAASASTTTGRVVSYDYSADWTSRWVRPALIEERVNNIQTKKTVMTYVSTSTDQADVDSYRDGSNYQRTRIENVRSDDLEEGGELILAKNADLSQVSHSGMPGNYSGGTFTYSSTGQNWREMTVHGSSSSSGATAETFFGSQAFSSIYQIQKRSTLDLSIRDVAGNVIRLESYVYTAAYTWTLISYETRTYDAAGRLLTRAANNGTLLENAYNGGHLASTKDAAGTETQYTYDALGRVATSIKKGASAYGYTTQSDITTSYTYDGANHVTQTQITGGSLTLTSTGQFDLAGRQTQAVAPGSYTTGIGYTSNGKIVTTTLPGGATKVTEVYLDGQAKSVSGTAVVAENYAPFIDTGTGKKAVQSYLGGVSSGWTNTYFDWLGRKSEVYHPEWGGSSPGRFWYYNSYGQLYKFTQPGMADTLYVYDTQGVQIWEGLDLNANGALDTASNDRISNANYSYESWDSGVTWWLYKPTYTYATGSSGTMTSTGYTLERLNKPSGYLSLDYSVDVFGNATYHEVYVDRASKLAYDSTVYPNSSTTAQSTTFNGLVVSNVDSTGVTMTYGYDALARKTQDTDPRTGTTTTAYVSGTSQVSSVTDPSSVVQAAYTYDSAGRVATMTNGLSKVCRYSYSDRDESYRVWGDTDYPVEYGYDTSGRRTTMKTYRGGSGWTGSAWPTSTVGTADTTTWAYDAATGLLSSKADAASQSMSYTYTTARQLATRTDARSIVTTYSYDSGTGEQTGISYSDSTPSVSYTYNRLGKTSQVTDTTGTRTFTYNLGGTLELQNEIVGTSSGNFYGDHRITRGYDSIKRYNALYVGNSSNYANDYGMSYTYDSVGRMNQAWNFSYSYIANSHLLDTTSYSGWHFTDVRTYDLHHDWLASRTTSITTATPATKAAFTYTPDAIGRITQVAKTGEVFSRYGNGTQGLTTYYGYDDRSQVTSEQTKIGTTSTVLTGRDDSQAYDSIGNRATLTHNGNTATYASNALNQIDHRTVPGVFDVAGAAATGATVTVNGSSSGVTRHGEYFFDGFGVTNSSNAVYSSLSISDGTTTTSLPAFVAKTAEYMAYDYAGNMTSDGRWDYTYDAESRIVSIQTHTALSPSIIANADARRLEFKYDYMGRRVEKIVRGGYNGSSYSTVITDIKFLYDGWNVLFEYNAASSLAWLRAYVWGLDISGTLQGAGGVGGLLWCYEINTGKQLLPCYDAMGNIHGMVDSSNGALVAGNEYDAFGNCLRQSGTSAGVCPFRFSSKYTDDETSLVYYGRRYYSPSQGRFLGRDPIEEKGGLHLYAFCRNNGINTYDYLGMDPPRWIGNPRNPYGDPAEISAAAGANSAWTGLGSAVSHGPVSGVFILAGVAGTGPMGIGGEALVTGSLDYGVPGYTSGVIGAGTFRFVGGGVEGTINSVTLETHGSAILFVGSDLVGIWQTDSGWGIYITGKTGILTIGLGTTMRGASPIDALFTGLVNGSNAPSASPHATPGSGAPSASPPGAGSPTIIYPGVSPGAGTATPTAPSGTDHTPNEGPVVPLEPVIVREPRLPGTPTTPTAPSAPTGPTAPVQTGPPRMGRYQNEIEDWTTLTDYYGLGDLLGGAPTPGARARK